MFAIYRINNAYIHMQACRMILVIQKAKFNIALNCIFSDNLYSKKTQNVQQRAFYIYLSKYLEYLFNLYEKNMHRISSKGEIIYLKLFTFFNFGHFFLISEHCATPEGIATISNEALDKAGSVL